MARSPLTDKTNDLLADSGAVIWSFVKGEQLEFPVTLGFLKGAVSTYTYEAVVIEAANDGTATMPTAIATSGAQTILGIRLPVERGNWQDVQAYNSGEFIVYASKTYCLDSGVARVSSITPDVDPLWIADTSSKVFLQFPKTLGATWARQPTVEIPVYGFFELRVTEPATSSFQQTWKPVRGSVQLLFSPTEIVPDV